MVIVKDLENDEIYLAEGVDDAHFDMDKTGIGECIASKEVVVVGKTVYEFSYALSRFKNNWGARWKIILRDAWFTGGYPNSTPRDDIPALQRLRNQLGEVL